MANPPSTSQTAFPRTRIKICGVRRVEDALAAARAGADAIGMVFHPPAPRNVSPDIAKQILAALPPFVSPVGLFVDRTADEVNAIAASLGLRHVQLHGHESPDMVRQVRGIVLKAIRVTRDTLTADLDQWRREIARGGLEHLRGWVLESAGPAAGGSGVENDWAAIRDAIDSGAFEGLPPIIAAGGLSPANVAEVIRAIRPWAVDVSSGVERVKGEKSVELIEGFVAAVRAGDASR